VWGETVWQVHGVYPQTCVQTKMAQPSSSSTNRGRKRERAGAAAREVSPTTRPQQGPNCGAHALATCIRAHLTEAHWSFIRGDRALWPLHQEDMRLFLQYEWLSPGGNVEEWLRKLEDGIISEEVGHAYIRWHAFRQMFFRGQFPKETVTGIKTVLPNRAGRAALRLSTNYETERKKEMNLAQDLACEGRLARFKGRGVGGTVTKNYMKKYWKMCIQFPMRLVSPSFPVCIIVKFANLPGSTGEKLSPSDLQEDFILYCVEVRENDYTDAQREQFPYLNYAQRQWLRKIRGDTIVEPEVLGLAWVKQEKNKPKKLESLFNRFPARSDPELAWDHTTDPSLKASVYKKNQARFTAGTVSSTGPFPTEERMSTLPGSAWFGAGHAMVVCNENDSSWLIKNSWGFKPVWVSKSAFPYRQFQVLSLCPTKSRVGLRRSGVYNLRDLTEALAESLGDTRRKATSFRF
jgi:hypothetical protein